MTIAKNFVFVLDYVEKVYRAAGSQPHRPGFDALKYTRSTDETTKVAKGSLNSFPILMSFNRLLSLLTMTPRC